MLTPTLVIIWGGRSTDSGFYGPEAQVSISDVAPNSTTSGTPKGKASSTHPPAGTGSTARGLGHQVAPKSTKALAQILADNFRNCGMGQALGFSGVTGCNGPQAPAAANAPQAPNAPAAPPVVTPGSVQQQMASLPIPASALRSQLNGFSLRNANTNIYADGSSHTLNTTILGQSVTITVTPVRYDFGYGDGTRKTTSTPGGPLKDDGFETPTTTGHVYKETGKYSITLTTHYAGTFSVNGGPTQTIPGTATVDSTPMPLQIWRTKHYQVQAACTPGSTAPGCVPPGG